MRDRALPAQHSTRPGKLLLWLSSMHQSTALTRKLPHCTTNRQQLAASGESRDALRHACPEQKPADDADQLTNTAVAAQPAQVDLVRLAQQTHASCIRYAMAVSLPGGHELIRSWTPVAMQHPSLSMGTMFECW